MEGIPKREQKQLLREYYKEAEALGKTVRQVADELVVNESSVRGYCKKHGITLQKVRRIIP